MTNGVEYECEECGEPATWCIQSIVMAYPYDPKTGDFGERVELDTDCEADWYCAECAKKLFGLVRGE